VLDVRDAEARLDFAGEVRGWAAPTDRSGVQQRRRSGRLPSARAVPEDDAWLWDINFRGVVNGTQAFLPILVEQDEGAIVNTSRVFGLAGMPNQSAYCSAKFAVRGFTDSLRQELRGTGVTAIDVHPGGINTNIVATQSARNFAEETLKVGVDVRGFDIDHRIEGLVGEGQVLGAALHEIEVRQVVPLLAEGDAGCVEVQPRVGAGVHRSHEV
jgi:NAD(P)-dependent dehydrogenase (short-subunit alcohol dehydrogenase family)